MEDISSHVSLDGDADWCSECRRLRQELSEAKNSHSKSCAVLKEKIISTDLLIRKYTAKTREYTAVEKRLEEATRKLASLERECDTLTARLQESIQQVEPLTKFKSRAERELKNNESRLEELKAQAEALQAHNLQLTSFVAYKDVEIGRLIEQNKTLEAQNSELKKQVDKGKKSAKESSPELQALKTENRDLLKTKRALQKRHDKLKSSLEKKGLLAENGALVSRRLATYKHSVSCDQQPDVTPANRESRDDVEVDSSPFDSFESSGSENEISAAEKAADKRGPNTRSNSGAKQSDSEKYEKHKNSAHKNVGNNKDASEIAGIEPQNNKGSEKKNDSQKKSRELVKKSYVSQKNYDSVKKQSDSLKRRDDSFRKKNAQELDQSGDSENTPSRTKRTTRRQSFRNTNKHDTAQTINSDAQSEPASMAQSSQDEGSNPECQETGDTTQAVGGSLSDSDSTDSDDYDVEKIFAAVGLFELETPLDTAATETSAQPGTSSDFPGTSSSLPGTISGVVGTSSRLAGTSSGLPGTSLSVPGTSTDVPGTSNDLAGTSAGSSSSRRPACRWSLLPALSPLPCSPVPRQQDSDSREDAIDEKSPHRGPNMTSQTPPQRRSSGHQKETVPSQTEESGKEGSAQSAKKAATQAKDTAVPRPFLRNTRRTIRPIIAQQEEELNLTRRNSRTRLVASHKGPPPGRQNTVIDSQSVAGEGPEKLQSPGLRRLADCLSDSESGENETESVTSENDVSAHTCIPFSETGNREQIKPEVTGSGQNKQEVTGNEQNKQEVTGNEQKKPEVTGSGHNKPEVTGNGQIKPEATGSGHNKPDETKFGRQPGRKSTESHMKEDIVENGTAHSPTEQARDLTTCTSVPGSVLKHADTSAFHAVLKSGNVNENKSIKMSENETGKTNENETGKMSETEIGKMDENQTGKVSETETRKMSETETGKICENETRKINENETEDMVVFERHCLLESVHSLPFDVTVSVEEDSNVEEERRNVTTQYNLPKAQQEHTCSHVDAQNQDPSSIKGDAQNQDSSARKVDAQNQDPSSSKVDKQILDATTAADVTNRTGTRQRSLRLSRQQSLTNQNTEEQNSGTNENVNESKQSSESNEDIENTKTSRFKPACKESERGGTVAKGAVSSETEHISNEIDSKSTKSEETNPETTEHATVPSETSAVSTDVGDNEAKKKRGKYSKQTTARRVTRSQTSVSESSESEREAGSAVIGRKQPRTASKYDCVETNVTDDVNANNMMGESVKSSKMIANVVKSNNITVEGVKSNTMITDDVESNTMLTDNVKSNTKTADDVTSNENIEDRQISSDNTGFLENGDEIHNSVQEKNGNSPDNEIADITVPTDVLEKSESRDSCYEELPTTPLCRTFSPSSLARLGPKPLEALLSPLPASPARLQSQQHTTTSSLSDNEIEVRTIIPNSQQKVNYTDNPCDQEKIVKTKAQNEGLPCDSSIIHDTIAKTEKRNEQRLNNNAEDIGNVLHSVSGGFISPQKAALQILSSEKCKTRPVQHQPTTGRARRSLDLNSSTNLQPLPCTLDNHVNDKAVMSLPPDDMLNHSPETRTSVADDQRNSETENAMLSHSGNSQCTATQGKETSDIDKYNTSEIYTKTKVNKPDKPIAEPSNILMVPPKSSPVKPTTASKVDRKRSYEQEKVKVLAQLQKRMKRNLSGVKQTKNAATCKSIDTISKRSSTQGSSSASTGRSVTEGSTSSSTERSITLGSSSTEDVDTSSGYSAPRRLAHAPRQTDQRPLTSSSATRQRTIQLLDTPPPQHTGARGKKGARKTSAVANEKENTSKDKKCTKQSGDNDNESKKKATIQSLLIGTTDTETEQTTRMAVSKGNVSAQRHSDTETEQTTRMAVSKGNVSAQRHSDTETEQTTRMAVSKGNVSAQRHSDTETEQTTRMAVSKVNVSAQRHSDTETEQTTRMAVSKGNVSAQRHSVDHSHISEMMHSGLAAKSTQENDKTDYKSDKNNDSLGPPECSNTVDHENTQLDVAHSISSPPPSKPQSNSVIAESDTADKSENCSPTPESRKRPSTHASQEVQAKVARSSAVGDEHTAKSVLAVDRELQLMLRFRTLELTVICQRLARLTPRPSPSCVAERIAVAVKKNSTDDLLSEAFERCNSTIEWVEPLLSDVETRMSQLLRALHEHGAAEFPDLLEAFLQTARTQVLQPNYVTESCVGAASDVSTPCVAHQCALSRLFTLLCRSCLPLEVARVRVRCLVYDVLRVAVIHSNQPGPGDSGLVVAACAMVWPQVLERTQTDPQKPMLSVFEYFLLASPDLQQPMLSVFEYLLLASPRNLKSKEKLNEVQHRQLSEVQHEQLSEVQHEQLSEVQHRQLSEVQHRQLSEVQHEQLSEVQQRQLSAVQQRQLSEVQHRQLSKVQQRQLSEVQHRQLSEVQHEQLAIFLSTVCSWQLPGNDPRDLMTQLVLRLADCGRSQQKQYLRTELEASLELLLLAQRWSWLHHNVVYGVALSRLHVWRRQPGENTEMGRFLLRLLGLLGRRCPSAADTAVILDALSQFVTDVHIFPPDVQVLAIQSITLLLPLCPDKASNVLRQWAAKTGSNRSDVYSSGDAGSAENRSRLNSCRDMVEKALEICCP